MQPVQVILSLVPILMLALAQSQFILLPSQLRSSLTNLTDFSISVVSFSTSKVLLVYGGQQNGTATSTFYEIDMTVSPFSFKNINIGTNSIPARYGHCTVVESYKVFVYGGIGITKNTLNDLWQYNQLTKTWVKIGTTTNYYSKCNLVYINNSIYILGIVNQQLAIEEARMVDPNGWYEMINLNYTYGSSVKIMSKTWLNTNIEYEFPVELSQPLSVDELGSLQYTSSLPASLLTALHDEDLGVNKILLMTENKICELDLTSMKISMLHYFQNIKANLKVLKIKSWIFFVGSNQAKIWFHYLKYGNYDISGLDYYSNFVTNTLYYQVYIINTDIYFSDSKLRTWVFREKCQQPWPENSLDCFYDKYYCKPGFRGLSCTEPTCPNTLFLYDTISHQELLFECSSNGYCKNGTCICDEGWLGDDCSQYNRTSCTKAGQIIDNWPIMNCECTSETVGGNDCETKFCFNDCTGNGQCMPTGKCVCNSHYYGEDCSVTIIEFQGVDDILIS